ncbi:uncharacterized protein BYT42DRAFT_578129 [Radiomyces spectabilis]|uniref:uncharacterized protein n=1 Tax=Radiomyces spectabilis TaxID=64574 RepID=UPI002220BB47|nr:uncharacterized protein BYT42DRAFT_578129 [Radiomyces spectabilis]KAI8372816.1 hypothetical protein BYT42DRAFT_578129 [Radiomyces spectabilis]
MKFCLLAVAAVALLKLASADVPSIYTCQQRYTVATSDESCTDVANKFDISTKQLVQWNKDLRVSPETACSALEAGSEYCVKVITNIDAHYCIFLNNFHTCTGRYQQAFAIDSTCRQKD